MKFRGIALAVCAALTAAALPAAGAEDAPDQTEHPGNVALISQDGGWKYVHFPTNVRLYVYDKDAPGKSNCMHGCAGAWPPLAADDDDSRIGDWTVLVREDGRRQWTYKGKPVYTRYHDSATEPLGHQPDEGWRFLEP